MGRYNSLQFSLLNLSKCLLPSSFSTLTSLGVGLGVRTIRRGSIGGGLKLDSGASERVPELTEDEDIVYMCKGALMTREKENVEGNYDILMFFQRPSYTERV
jgi:hypothetical protein